MQNKSFKRMRSDINSNLAIHRKAHYKKDSPEDPRKVLLHCLAQFNIDLELPEMKHSVCKAILHKWISSNFSLTELDYHSRVESANWYADISRRNEKRGMPKGLSEGVHKNIISHLPAKKFYSSREWRHIRYEILSENGNSCQCCGAEPSDGIKIHVDHIKPRSVFPELALNKENLQILCEDCNLGKSNIRSDDWRV